jgi:hypothetical protein
LLDLQDEITYLEKELDDIDQDDYYEDPNRLQSREYDIDRAARDGVARSRRVILADITAKLAIYGMPEASILYNRVMLMKLQMMSSSKPARYSLSKNPLIVTTAASGADFTVRDHSWMLKWTLYASRKILSHCTVDKKGEPLTAA